MGNMNTDHWEKIMRLFACVILVDGKVYDEEVVCFADMVDYLSRRLPIKQRVSRVQALSWFAQNRKFIARDIAKRGMDKAARDAILAVEHFPNKKDLLIVMRQIAHVDGLFHPSEQGVVQQAAKFWKLETV